MNTNSVEQDQCRNLYLDLLNSHKIGLGHGHVEWWLRKFQETDKCDYINDLSIQRIAIMSYYKKNTPENANTKQKEQVTDQCYVHYYTKYNTKLLKGLSINDRIGYYCRTQYNKLTSKYNS